MVSTRSRDSRRSMTLQRPGRRDCPSWPTCEGTLEMLTETGWI